jgi:protein SCO1/2
MTSSSKGFIIAAGIVVLLGLGLAAFLPRLAPTTGGPSLAIGGPFTLTDGAGRTVTDHDVQGRWQLVYFGYTHCPDVCPTTLSGIGAALNKMPPDARARLGVLFITVDPQRDTPKVVGDYAHAFGPEFVGLTGTPGQITRVEQEYRVYAAKHPLKGGDYAMDHSSVIYIMDPKGGFAGVLDDTLAPQDMARRLEQLGA